MTFLKHCKTGLLAFWLAPKNRGKSGLHHEHVAPQQTPEPAPALPHRLSATSTTQPRRARRPGGSQPRAQRPQPAEEQEGGGMSWQAYEAAKRAWIDANPGATPEQYETAMRAIARRYGV